LFLCSPIQDRLPFIPLGKATQEIAPQHIVQSHRAAVSRGTSMRTSALGNEYHTAEEAMFSPRLIDRQTSAGGTTRPQPPTSYAVVAGSGRGRAHSLVGTKHGYVCTCATFPFGPLQPCWTKYHSPAILVHIFIVVGVERMGGHLHRPPSLACVSAVALTDLSGAMTPLRGTVPFSPHSWVCTKIATDLSIAYDEFWCHGHLGAGPREKRPKYKSLATRPGL
jgi:hypothetical protein